MNEDDLGMAVNELTDGIHEIKLNTEILVTKLEQVNINIAKIESSVEDLHLSISQQDRRLTILEQLIPPNLVQDMALMKQNQKTFSKFLWLVGGATLTTLAHMIMNLISSK